MATHAANIPKNAPAKTSKVQRKESDNPVQKKSFANDTAFVDSKNQSSLSAMHAGIQAKLSIGEPGDKFEQEADNTAARVMSKPESAVQLQSAEPEEVQQMTEESSSAKATEDKEGAVSTKKLLQPALFESEQDVPNDMLNAKEDASFEASVEEGAVQAKESKQNPGSDFENKLSSSKAGGEKLPTDTQTEMESRFGGKDFSNVRVHTDSASTEMNKDVKSKAFTNENHIFFNSGQFNSGDSGKELLAHELTHTIQQGASGDRDENNLQRQPLIQAKTKKNPVIEVSPEEDKEYKYKWQVKLAITYNSPIGNHTYSEVYLQFEDPAEVHVKGLIYADIPMMKLEDKTYFYTKSPNWSGGNPEWNPYDQISKVKLVITRSMNPHLYDPEKGDQVIYGWIVDDNDYADIRRVPKKEDKEKFDSGQWEINTDEHISVGGKDVFGLWFFTDYKEFTTSKLGTGELFSNVENKMPMLNGTVINTLNYDNFVIQVEIPISESVNPHLFDPDQGSQTLGGWIMAGERDLDKVTNFNTRVNGPSGNGYQRVIQLLEKEWKHATMTFMLRGLSPEDQEKLIANTSATSKLKSKLTQTEIAYATAPWTEFTLNQKLWWIKGSGNDEDDLSGYHQIRELVTRSSKAGFDTDIWRDFFIGLAGFRKTMFAPIIIIGSHTKDPGERRLNIIIRDLGLDSTTEKSWLKAAGVSKVNVDAELYDFRLEKPGEREIDFTDNEQEAIDQLYDFQQVINAFFDLKKNPGEKAAKEKILVDRIMTLKLGVNIERKKLEGLTIAQYDRLTDVIFSFRERYRNSFLRAFQKHALKAAHNLLDHSEQMLFDNQALTDNYMMYIRHDLKRAKGIMDFKSDNTRKFFAEKYPVLGMDTIDLIELWTLLVQNNTKNAAREYIEEKIAEKHEAIQETRVNLQSDNDKIWELENVIEYTKTGIFGLKKGSIMDQMVNTKFESVANDKFWVNMFLLAAGIASLILTLGASAPLLIAIGVGIGVVTAVIDVAIQYEEYNFLDAASKAKFNQVYALTGKEPSMIWLVLAFVSLGLELVAVLRLIKAVKLIAPKGIGSADDVANVNKAVNEAAGQMDNSSTVTKVITEAAETELNVVTKAEKTESGLKSILNKVVPTKNGGFRFNKKKIPNRYKIKGQPESVKHIDAAREAYAAEKAAARADIERVHVGLEADKVINKGKKGLSADVVAVTRDGKYMLTEAKGANITHALDQLKHSALSLGKKDVIRYDLIIPEKIQKGYKVIDGILYESDGFGGFFQSRIFPGTHQPIYVTFTSSI